MNLDNLAEIIVYYLLVEEMTCLNHWDEFPLTSALMYVMHIR